MSHKIFTIQLQKCQGSEQSLAAAHYVREHARHLFNIPSIWKKKRWKDFSVYYFSRKVGSIENKQNG